MSGFLSARERVKQARRSYWRITDFDNNILGQALEHAASGAGAGQNYSVPPDANRFGHLQMSTGTTTTGRAQIATNSSFSSHLFGGGTYVIECDFKLTNLPDGTETFSMRLGWVDANVRASIVDGVYYEVDWSGSVARHSLITIANSVETRTALTGSPDTNKHVLTLVVEPNGTTVSVFIDDVSVFSGAPGNVPSGITRLFGMSFGIEKSAGTTARLVDMDRVGWGVDFTAAR